MKIKPLVILLIIFLVDNLKSQISNIFKIRIKTQKPTTRVGFMDFNEVPSGFEPL